MSRCRIFREIPLLFHKGSGGSSVPPTALCGVELRVAEESGFRGVRGRGDLRQYVERSGTNHAETVMACAVNAGTANGPVRRKEGDLPTALHGQRGTTVAHAGDDAQ